jgi:hypothetical protein
MGRTIGGIPEEEFGGSHSNGTGTYEARTPEQARALYNELPKGSRAEADRLARERNPEDEKDRDQKGRKGR